MRLPKITFWRAVAALILLAGAGATYLRVTRGLGGSTHLTDQFPWGLWIGFDILCGVGLAAGGFTLAAIVHIFHIKKFEPIVRPTILTAFLGYLLVIVGLMYDLGRPFDIWHAIIMWNPNSVMFEVAWCVMLYTTVLALEFAPVVLEKFGWHGAQRVLRWFQVPIIIAGVLLSTLHQSSLGSLYLIMPEKMYPLWYSPYIPLMFYISAIAVGCAMVVFESTLSARAFKRGLELHLLTDIARVCVVALGMYATLKFVDLAYQGLLPTLFVARRETWLWWAEIGIGTLIPLALLGVGKVRESPRGLFAGAVLVITGFVLNRLNVSLTAFEGYAGTPYFPHWAEIAVTMSIVVVGFIAFAVIARWFPVFEIEGAHDRARIREADAETLRRRMMEELAVVERAG